MNIFYDGESQDLLLESESAAEYWQLSWLAKEAPLREKFCDGQTIQLRLSLEKNQRYVTA